MLLGAFCLPSLLLGQETRVRVAPEMLVNEVPFGDPSGIVDEQELAGDPPSGAPESHWDVSSRFNREFPVSAYIDLGTPRNLSAVWIYDTFNIGDLTISYGTPGKWKELVTFDCGTFQRWHRLPADVTTRFVRYTRQSPSAIFAETVLYEYTPDGYQDMLARKDAEAKAHAVRAARLAKAREQAAKRPLIDLGEPYGRLSLVDEVVCGESDAGHDFLESAQGIGSVATILGQPCRVLPNDKPGAKYFSYRLGTFKLLKPGAAYVLSVEYPEDRPRTMVVLNAGAETVRAFHTGATVGDALHSRYVNSNPESLDVPLSGKFEAWSTLFFLHDRFPDVKFIRGSGDRPMLPENGFRVTVAQFPPKNAPLSAGAAVSRIRLFEVPRELELAQPIRHPPEALPRRHVFYREEMADGVIASAKSTERGVDEPIRWFEHKMRLMRFLGIRTYSKDLLEFGACQHWDPTEGGGNDWVHFNRDHKGLWKEILDLTQRYGYEVLPYYEYAGGKGDQSIGYQRRCRPLGDEDQYTHIQWCESANADITDPETIADAKKLLEFTVVRHKDRACFAGVWFRPRPSQVPISFADGALARFARDANRGQEIRRESLRRDEAQLDRYYDWWFKKRRDFLQTLQKSLCDGGVAADPVVLYTADTSEPGKSLPGWEKRVVTDDPGRWQPIVADEAHKQLVITRLDDVIQGNGHLNAQLMPPKNWGPWEWHHSCPQPDPRNCAETRGILMTYAFNRLYTVGSDAPFETFRSLSGLAVVRHYCLNENEMEETLGYFVTDVERTGPYCMLAEARAMAHGDPTHIGYLAAHAFNRGFPKYVRRFHAAFLSLPALPSQRLDGASGDREVVLRAISTERHGTYLAAVNVGLSPKIDVWVRLPTGGRVTDNTTGEELRAEDGKLKLSFYPCELKAIHIESPSRKSQIRAG